MTGEGGEEVDPPAPTVDKTELAAVIAEVNLSIYQYVKDQAIEAQEVFDNKDATQEMVTAITQKLTVIIQNAKELEKNTFKAVNEETLKAKYFEFYGQPAGGETETDAFAQSDFGELNQMVKDTINYLLPDFAQNGDEQNTIQTGLKRQFQICIARSNNLLVDYSDILKAQMDKIKAENSPYASLKDEPAYTATDQWEYKKDQLLVIEYVEIGNPSNRLRKLNEGDEGETIPGEGEDEGTKYDIVLKEEEHGFYIINDAQGCNITTIKDLSLIHI